MFSIYGENGRAFKGAMDDLRKVQAVGRVNRARRIELQNPVQAVGLSASTLNLPSDQPEATPKTLSRSALAAYAQTVATQMPRHILSRVADVMSRQVLAVRADMEVVSAWQMLSDKGIGQAPVVDRQGVLVGLLTRIELLRPDHLPLPGGNTSSWQALLAQRVGTVMRTPVTAVEEQTDIRHVAQILLDSGLPGLPVVKEDGTVVGFVSRTDILRAVVHDPPLDLWS